MALPNFPGYLLSKSTSRCTGMSIIRGRASERPRSEHWLLSVGVPRIRSKLFRPFAVYACVHRYSVQVAHDPSTLAHVIVRLDSWTGQTKVELWNGEE